MTPNKGLSATNVRLVFIVLFVVVLAGFVSLYYFGNDYLTVRSADLHTALTNSVSTTSNSSFDNRSRSVISGSASLLSKVDAVYAPIGNYQETTGDVVRNFATKSNFPIDNIDFQTTSTASNTKSFEIKISNPVNYNSLLSFLIYIERALPRMYVTKLNIAADKTNPDKVKINNLTLEVFVK